MDIKKLLGENYETVSKAADEAGFSIIVDNKADPKYVPIDRVHALTRQKSELEKQIKSSEDALAEAQKIAGDNTELAKKIKALETEKAAILESGKKSRIEAALKVEALKSNAIDADDVVKFVNYDNIKENEDGSILGVAEQVKALTQSKAHLFKPTAPQVPPQPGNPAQAGDNQTIQSQVYAAMGVAAPTK